MWRKSHYFTPCSFWETTKRDISPPKSISQQINPRLRRKKGSTRGKLQIDPDSSCPKKKENDGSGRVLRALPTHLPKLTPPPIHNSRANLEQGLEIRHQKSFSKKNPQYRSTMLFKGMFWTSIVHAVVELYFRLFCWKPYQTFPEYDKGKKKTFLASHSWHLPSPLSLSSGIEASLLVREKKTSFLHPFWRLYCCLSPLKI